MTNLDHLCHLRYLFLCFKVVSGLKLKINFSKTVLVPVRAVGDVGDLARILGCWVSFLLMKYLGPLSYL